MKTLSLFIVLLGTLVSFNSFACDQGKKDTKEDKTPQVSQGQETGQASSDHAGAVVQTPHK